MMDDKKLTKPEIQQSPSANLEKEWSHYRILMRVEDPNRREFYLTESANEGWTSRQLERQINSFFYERLLATQKENRPEIAGEVLKLEPKTDADYILKDPYYLGVPRPKGKRQI
jgi:predicted nuclease of restriction endonuclease-like (RecB) superfamily